MKIRDELRLLAAGCLIYSLSMMMIEPIELIPGSFLGLAVVCHKLLGTQIGVINLILNIPVMILCVRIFGRKMLIYTIIIMAATSVLMDLFVMIEPKGMYLPGSVIALAGGAVMGIGAGMLLAAGGTMTGTTALARIINSRRPMLSVGSVLIVLDSLIILSGCILLHSFSALLYSLLYTLSCSGIIDLVLAVIKHRSVQESLL